MSEAVVADTHTLIWYLDGDQRLSTTALEALDAATASGQPIFVSPITILEASYLEEGGKVAPDTVDRLLELFEVDDSAFEVCPIDLDAIISAVRAPWTGGDPADRVIAGTAKSLGLTLVTRDEEITASGYVETTW